MDELAAAMAKLAGIKRSLEGVRDENVSRARSEGKVLTRATFSFELVGHFFEQAESQLKVLKRVLPDLFGDFQNLSVVPDTQMATEGPVEEAPWHYSRAQVARLIRDIEQMFELRANSELHQPREAVAPPRRVFITHGRSLDWRAVQAFVEKDVGIATLELAQQPNQGRTLLEKLLGEAERCDGAVIVMTGDDLAADGEHRVRENVMHEIGFFQGRYGRDRVVLLHEEGVVIPSNLGGVAYVPFPKGGIDGCFHVLQRELKAMYP